MRCCYSLYFKNCSFRFKNVIYGGISDFFNEVSYVCGIVGHLGPQNSVELVLEGLKRLEYRGYDSAGVSFIDEHDELHNYKKSGKLENLKAHLGDGPFVARSCIGHTRWATLMVKLTIPTVTPTLMSTFQWFITELLKMLLS